MSLKRIVCPECRAGLKSATGFEPGQVVSCLKCESEFTVDDATSAVGMEDEEVREWSYKNSWMRFAVLGVLLVVLGVLGYMLYEKKMKESKDTAARTDDIPSEPVPPPPAGLKGIEMPMPKIPGPGVGGPKGGKGIPAPAPIPMPAAFSVDEAKKMITGMWEARLDDGAVHSVDYKDDGTFLYSAAKNGQSKSIPGTWKTLRATKFLVAPPDEVYEFQIEWTVDGKIASKDPSMFMNGTLRHRVLDPLEGVRPVGIFKKKS